MKRSVRSRYGRLLGGVTLLLAGVGFVVYTFSFPMASTLVACPDHMTHWELFGVSLPVVRSIGIDPMKMQLSWRDGCNLVWTSLWIPLGGVSGILLGGVATVAALGDHYM